MTVINLDLAKKLYIRFATLYGEKFTKNHVNDEYVKIWWQDWAEGLLGIDVTHVKNAVDYCKLNLEWPPSLAEFIKICEKSSGMPTYYEAMQAAIRRDFYHPIIKILFDRIGSWDIQHDNEEVLLRKFKQLHSEEANKYRLNIQKEARLLEDKPLRVINDATQGREANPGRETPNHNPVRTGVRKVTEYLP